MIARTGAILFAIIILSFITVLLLADLINPKGFKKGESLSTFINFLLGEGKSECECEFNSQLQEHICNSFCGEFSGKSCMEREDCLR
ncbi:MAG: hypothetical protein QW040_03710 [Candidatus Aenigmatarchaeota archaeon]